MFFVFINLDEIIEEYGFNNLPSNKIKAEKFDCEVRIFLAKRAGMAEIWITDNNIETYSQYVKNKQEYTCFIMDNRYGLVDIFYTLLDKSIPDFLEKEREKYHSKSASSLISVENILDRYISEQLFLLK